MAFKVSFHSFFQFFADHDLGITNLIPDCQPRTQGGVNQWGHVPFAMLRFGKNLEFSRNLNNSASLKSKNCGACNERLPSKSRWSAKIKRSGFSPDSLRNQRIAGPAMNGSFQRSAWGVRPREPAQGRKHDFFPIHIYYHSQMVYTPQNTTH